MNDLIERLRKAAANSGAYTPHHLVAEGADEIQRLTALVAELEKALDKACEPIETQPKVGSSIDYANGFRRGAQSQRMRAWAARKSATEQEVSDE